MPLEEICLVGLSPQKGRDIQQVFFLLRRRDAIVGREAAKLFLIQCRRFLGSLRRRCFLPTLRLAAQAVNHQVELPAGRHSVELRNPAFDTYQTEIEVSSGETSICEHTFRKGGTGQ